jgi:uncharacterized membrane protein YccC
MIGWLRRLEPGRDALRRGGRVTLVACLCFYTCRYGLDNRTLATYALFGVVAMGGLSQIPGSPAQRARTLLALLPVGWLLVTLGTLLAVRDVTAAAGMFVLGFAVSFAAVGGPRMVGVVNGLQLLYILPCFPPYAPESLLFRLAGLTLAMVLLAIAEVTLWPDPTPPPYESVLARAVSTLADCLDAAARSVAGEAPGRAGLATALVAANGAAEAIRPLNLQPGQRPASASRRDHALSQAGAVVRYTVSRLQDLRATDGTDQLRAPAAAVLLAETAATTRMCVHWLSGQSGAPSPAPITAALARFQQARLAVDPSGAHPDRLRLGSLARAIADATTVLVYALRVVAGAAGPAESRSLWFATTPTWRLWWRRLRAHFTPRSVYFQGALRLALALALARLLAGVLDLSHGFWVLLAVLTLLRTSAAQTRMASWPVLFGTALGAVVAGALLVLVAQEHVYAIVLPLIMFAGFTLTPAIGLFWGQALFTLVIMFIFAQLAPADWHIAEARVIDVAVGVGVGVLIGLFAWPRGGSGELHRATGVFLDDCAVAIRETVAVVTGAGSPDGALPKARTDVGLAEASFALYQSERMGHTPMRIDWHAAIVAGQHTVRGAEELLRSFPPGQLIICARPLQTVSDEVAARYADLSADLLRRHAVHPPGSALSEDQWPTDLGPELYHLADLRVWLEGLADDLTRVVPASP